ncbi:hypothetical protein R3I94_019336 [Phoxinus phoxinus]
MIPVQRGGV